MSGSPLIGLLDHLFGTDHASCFFGITMDVRFITGYGGTNDERRISQTYGGLCRGAATADSTASASMKTPARPFIERGEV